MNDANHKETGFDELDAALAAALGDASAWPAPRAGFEERCVACVEGILKGKKMRRPFWSLFGRVAFLKLAASLAVLLGAYALVFNELADSGPQVSEQHPALEFCSNDDIGYRCERTVRFLEKNVSRGAATKFLAKACTADGI